jgi:N-acetylneuraminate 9-O-acetyltransferase
VGAPFLWWAASVFPQAKVDYNHTNAYYGFIPLVTYIYFRNISLPMRTW